MKKNYFLFALILLSSISMLRAQKIDNLIELKQKSQNPLFHQLGKALKHLLLRVKVIGVGEVPW